MTRFWKRALKCKHKNLSPNYLVEYRCGTPYCMASEVHCLDCGAYITTCGCGSENGISGWPHSRWENLQRKEREKSCAQHRIGT